MINAPCWRADKRAVALSTASMTALSWVSLALVSLKGKIMPARPIRSRVRRISGAKITGIARSRAGRVVLTSQEKAGKFSKLVRNTMKTTRKIMPRRSVMACVSRRMYSNAKNISVTNRISITLSQFNRWKKKRKSLKKLVTGGQGHKTGLVLQPCLDYIGRRTRSIRSCLK